MKKKIKYLFVTIYPIHPTHTIRTIKFSREFEKADLHNVFETLILVIFDLIFAMKPPKFLKNLKISLKKKKNCETLDGFNEIHEMVSRVSKKRPFFKNTLVYREKIRPMWSNFTAIY